MSNLRRNIRGFFNGGKRLVKRTYCDHASSSTKSFQFIEDGDMPSQNTFNPIKRTVNGVKIAQYKYSYDKDFSLSAFQEGALHAFLRLNGKLLRTAYEEIKPLFISSIYNKIKKSLEQLNDEQRKILFRTTTENDVYHQKVINVQFQNDPLADARYFQISIMFSCVSNLDQVQNEIMKHTDKIPDDKSIPSMFAEALKFTLKTKPEFVFALLEFQKKVDPVYEPDWSISYMNYFYEASDS